MEFLQGSALRKQYNSSRDELATVFQIQNKIDSIGGESVTHTDADALLTLFTRITEEYRAIQRSQKL